MGAAVRARLRVLVGPGGSRFALASFQYSCRTGIYKAGPQVPMTCCGVPSNTTDAPSTRNCRLGRVFWTKSPVPSSPRSAMRAQIGLMLFGDQAGEAKGLLREPPKAGWQRCHRRDEASAGWGAMRINGAIMLMALLGIGYFLMAPSNDRPRGPAVSERVDRRQRRRSPSVRPLHANCSAPQPTPTPAPQQ